MEPELPGGPEADGAACTASADLWGCPFRQAGAHALLQIPNSFPEETSRSSGCLCHWTFAKAVPPLGVPCPEPSRRLLLHQETWSSEGPWLSTLWAAQHTHTCTLTQSHAHATPSVLFFTAVRPCALVGFTSARPGARAGPASVLCAHLLRCSLKFQGTWAQRGLM